MSNNNDQSQQQQHEDDENDDNNGIVLDYRKTPLNACSVETCCSLVSAVVVTDDDDDVNNNNAVMSYLPLCLGCYQLDESSGQRLGRLDLYAIPIKKKKLNNNDSNTDDVNDESTSYIDTFCDEDRRHQPPLTILGGDHDEDVDNDTERSSSVPEASGVLDGKWYPRSSSSSSSSVSSNYYATAHASGGLFFYKII